MPFIETKTNKKISPASEAKLRAAFGEAISLVEGKSERWLMLNFCDDCRMSFGGGTEPLALVSVELFGAARPEEYDALTEKLTALVSEELGIAPERIYVKYSELYHWGFAGSNF